MEIWLCEEIPEQIKRLVCKVLKVQKCHNVTVSKSLSLYYKLPNCFPGVGGAVQHQVSHQAVKTHLNSLSSEFKTHILVLK